MHVRVAVGGWVIGARRLTDWALRELAAGEDVECLAQAPRGAWVEQHGGAELAACKQVPSGEINGKQGARNQVALYRSRKSGGSRAFFARDLPRKPHYTQNRKR